MMVQAVPGAVLQQIMVVQEQDLAGKGDHGTGGGGGGCLCLVEKRAWIR